VLGAEGTSEFDDVAEKSRYRLLDAFDLVFSIPQEIHVQRPVADVPVG